jgi:hypothetical protein
VNAVGPLPRRTATGKLVAEAAVIRHSSLPPATSPARPQGANRTSDSGGEASAGPVVGAPASPTPAKGRRTAHRLFYLWLSVEMAAGIVGLVEIVFTFPSLIFLELGRTSWEQILPLFAVSGTVAVYLGRSAAPLVAEVARLGQPVA